MKAIFLKNDTDASNLLGEGTIKVPTPGAGEVLVQVCAAGVTPPELGWFPTRHSKTGERRRQPIPGHEFSGVVKAVGSGVTEVSVGEEVFGMNDWFADGAMAEYCLTVPAAIAPKPCRLTHAEAASVPISALTAWQCLFDRANLLDGDWVLVQGGAGAVGVYAVQLARTHGAYVTATARPENFDLLKKLGANEVIDYRTDYFAQNATRFDAVIDVVGGRTLDQSWELLKPKGQMVTIASSSAESTDERVKAAFLLVTPNRRQLLEIASMLDTGRLKTVVDTVVPFAHARDAYLGHLANRRGQGKVVVEVYRPAKVQTA
jgi:NADPH:quinone reductase-like Zn-dependent oxidoreductase